MRKAGVSGLVVAFVLVWAPAAQGRADQYKVTGGGQVVASSGQARPGDTVGFVAVDTDGDAGDAAQGEFQATQTSSAGPQMSIFHGRVTCLEPGGSDMARFGGVGRFINGTTTAFTVDVADNGESGNDMVVFQTSDEPCEDGNQVFEETTLARGNLTIHDSSGS